MPTFGTFYLLGNSYSNSARWDSTWFSIPLWLITLGFCSYLLDICSSTFESWLFRPLTVYQFGCFSAILIFLSCWHVLDISTLPDTLLENILFYFGLFLMCIDVSELDIIPVYFWFCCLCYLGLSKKSFCHQFHQRLEVLLLKVFISVLSHLCSHF